jgi:DNA-directed RNA polymerase specialized sigma24 family protein
MPADLHTFRDDQLLRRVADSSEGAFRALYERYEGTLLNKAVYYLGCQHEAKDCLQDVFVSIWVKRESLQVENLYNYLHQAVRFRALRGLKYNRLAASLDERLPRLTDHFLPSDALDYKELRSRPGRTHQGPAG